MNRSALDALELRGDRRQGDRPHGCGTSRFCGNALNQWSTGCDAIARATGDGVIGIGESTRPSHSRGMALIFRGTAASLPSSLAFGMAEAKFALEAARVDARKNLE